MFFASVDALFYQVIACMSLTRKNKSKISFYSYSYFNIEFRSNHILVYCVCADAVLVYQELAVCKHVWVGGGLLWGSRGEESDQILTLPVRCLPVCLTSEDRLHAC